MNLIVILVSQLKLSHVWTAAIKLLGKRWYLTVLFAFSFPFSVASARRMALTPFYELLLFFTRREFLTYESPPALER